MNKGDSKEKEGLIIVAKGDSNDYLTNILDYSINLHSNEEAVDINNIFSSFVIVNIILNMNNMIFIFTYENKEDNMNGEWSVCCCLETRYSLETNNSMYFEFENENEDGGGIYITTESRNRAFLNYCFDSSDSSDSFSCFSYLFNMS